MADKSPTVRDQSPGAIAARSARYAEWVNAMLLEAETPDSGFDPRLILGAIVDADTWEAALNAADSTLRSGKTIVGVSHTITGFRLAPSDDRYSQNENSLGVFAIVDAVDLETREEFTYGVGASNVLAILWQARQFGRIPGDFVITSRETANGELLSLRPVGNRTVKVDS
jgi:hypothetical protein